MLHISLPGRKHPYWVFVPNVNTMLRHLHQQEVGYSFRYKDIQESGGALNLDTDTIREKIQFFIKIGLVKQVAATWEQRKQYGALWKWFEIIHSEENKKLRELILKVDDYLHEDDRTFILDVLWFIHDKPVMNMKTITDELGYGCGEYPTQAKFSKHRVKLMVFSINAGRDVRVTIGEHGLELVYICKDIAEILESRSAKVERRKRHRGSIQELETA